MGQLLGYARVSTAEQNADLQSDELRAAGCYQVYVDQTSGVLDRRPKLDEVLAALRPGDTLVVWRLDRLGRSLRHLIEPPRADGCSFICSGALAQFEREIAWDRTVAGLAAARARGRKGGRPAKLSPEQRKTARKLYDEREHTVEQIGKILGWPYHYLSGPPAGPGFGGADGGVAGTGVDEAAPPAGGMTGVHSGFGWCGRPCGSPLPLSRAGGGPGCVCVSLWWPRGDGVGWSHLRHAWGLNTAPHSRPTDRRSSHHCSWVRAEPLGVQGRTGATGGWRRRSPSTWRRRRRYWWLSSTDPSETRKPTIAIGPET